MTKNLSEKHSYILLLSGGLDSVVNLYAAREAGEVKLALTFDYGQISAKKEIESADFFCKQLGVKHKIVDLPWLKDLTSTALVNSNQVLPTLKNLDDINEATESAKSVWVPNRNGVFINIAAAFAESLKINFIVPGFNKEEAVTFPDNSQAFIDACNNALRLSTLSKVQVCCFTADLDKVGLVNKAISYEVNLDKIWSCYRDGLKNCGECESCQRVMRALDVVEQ